MFRGLLFSRTQCIYLCDNWLNFIVVRASEFHICDNLKCWCRNDDKFLGFSDFLSVIYVIATL